MSYNGDGGSMAKRLKTDSEGVLQRFYSIMFPLTVQEIGEAYLVEERMPIDFTILDHTDSYSKNNYEPRRKRPESEPNNVLLFTIINPVYPITVDVLHTICKPNGQVLRIVIFKKNGVQAMVEFDNIDTAKRVKEALNGADIYAGCCTLKIEFAKPTKLNVYKNDMDSWDYTNPSGMDSTLARHLEDDPECTPFLPQTFPFRLPCWNHVPNRDKPPETAHARQAPLLQEPRFGVAPQLYPKRYEQPYLRMKEKGGQPQTNYMEFDENAYTNGRPSAYGDYVSERFPPAPVDKFVSPSPISPRMFLDVLANRYMVKREGLVAPPPPPPPPRGGTFPDVAQTNGVQGGAGCVLMAYGLDPNKANPDKLFNLFCLYGNVIRIKFLKTKEGCAMVQMGDSISVERSINHLKNMPLFGGTLQLGYSKQTFLSQAAQPYTLPDNSVSFKDFAASKNNRFINPGMASKNRIQGPAKILHFFNTPPDITEEQLFAVIEEKEVNKPSQIKLFPKKDRSSSGLMEFDNLEDAVNCLVNCNHVPIKNPDSKFPYVMKLCFSSSRTIRSPNGPLKEDPQQ